MNLAWVQLAGMIATLVAAAMTARNAHSANRSQDAANRSQADVAHRTTSLTELEKALMFTGQQLDELRSEVRDQHIEIRDLQKAHEECERDKRSLRRELAQLRRGGVA